MLQSRQSYTPLATPELLSGWVHPDTLVPGTPRTWLMEPPSCARISQRRYYVRAGGATSIRYRRAASGGTEPPR